MKNGKTNLLKFTPFFRPGLHTKCLTILLSKLSTFWYFCHTYCWYFHKTFLLLILRNVKGPQSRFQISSSIPFLHTKFNTIYYFMVRFSKSIYTYINTDLTKSDPKKISDFRLIPSSYTNFSTIQSFSKFIVHISKTNLKSQPNALT